MNDAANKLNEMESDPRKWFWLGPRKWFWFGAAAAGIGGFLFSDHAIHSRHQSMEDAFDAFLNPIVTVVGLVITASNAYLQSVLLDVAYRILKRIKKNITVSNSFGFWLVSGFLCNAVFLPMSLGIWDFLNNHFSPKLFLERTGVLFLDGVLFFGAGPLVLVLHILLRVPAGKLRTKLSKPARRLCPSFFKLLGK